MDLGLENKRVLVTGGSRGLGRAIAECFLEEGAKVSFCSRTPAVREGDPDPRGGGEVLFSDGVTEATEKMSRLGEVHGYVVDVADHEALARWVNESAEKLGGIDIVVSNASALGGEPRTKAGWQHQFDVDLLPSVTLWDNAYPWFRKSEAPSFVQIATITAVEHHAFGESCQSYGAMKAALVNYVCQLAYEYMSQGIRANCVSPGPVYLKGGSWDWVERNLPDYFAANLARQPAGRFGTPREIADVVTFIASPRASWITGDNIVVDGAFTKFIKY
jgi:NAD(P)-dependent dehydrogenase (short-subunit alcohol dehydrogenase family)